MSCDVVNTPYGFAMVVSSTTRPTTAPDLAFGRVIAEADTGRILWYDGAGWIILYEPPVTSFVPTVSAGAGTFGSASATMRYFRQNGWLQYSLIFTCTTIGTATVSARASLPVSVVADDAAGYGRNGNTGNMLQAVASAGLLIVLTYNNAMPVTTGQSFMVSGIVQMTSPYS